MIKMNNKAQAWSFDLIVAVLIFSGALIGLYLYAFNAPEENKNSYDELRYQANIFADILLTEGLPENWNENNVARIGIISGAKINETKINMFKNLVESNYDNTKILFRTNYNYYVTFVEPIIINGISVEGIGLINTNDKNLIKIARY